MRRRGVEARCGGAGAEALARRRGRCVPGQGEGGEAVGVLIETRMRRPPLSALSTESCY